mgnify:CR=1 FL=1
MSWKNILKEDLSTEVAYALLPIYDSIDKVYDSEIIEHHQGSDGVLNEGDVESLISYLLQDIEKESDEAYEKIMESVDELRKITGGKK